MRSCDEIRELLSAALDGQLTADEQAALDDHIAHCPACSALLDDLRSLQAATAHMEDIPAPAGFAEAVMAAVAAESAQNQDDNVVPFSAKLNRKPRPRWSRWVASVAAVAIIAVGAASLPDLMGGSKNASFDLSAPTAMEDSVSIQAEAMESLPQTSILSDGSDPYSAVSDSYSVESAESTVDTTAEGNAENQAEAPVHAGSQEPQSPAVQPVTQSAAQRILSGMTLREKLCQLFVVHPQALTGTSPVLTANEGMQQALTDWPVGGLLLDKSNMSDAAQLTGLTADLQAMSEIPLILTCDEEGGRVNRLMSTVGTTRVDAMLTYKDAGTDTAFANARTIAADLVTHGLNMDLAPVADVWSNTENTVIGDRAYSDDFTQAADLVAAAVEGFHAGGVACTLKHFPGHGDTSADSHYGSVYVYKTLDELWDNELLPFRAGIAAGADAVMIGHLIVPDVSDEPALFSCELVTGLLRQEMGFDGVVITDSLQMQAMTDYYSGGEIAVKAVQAGVDLLLCPVDLEQAVCALEAAVADGTIPESRIDESVARILTLKSNYGLLEE